MEILESMETKTRGKFKDLVVSRGVSCVIVDGVLGFAADVADEVGIPVVVSRTLSPCCLWVHYCLPKLVQSGEVPVQENKLDALISSVPGMESYLRGRDLPSYTRGNNVNYQNIELFMKESQQAGRARGLILNTFEDLDGPLLSHIQTLWTNVYTIGPLHAHLKSRLMVESVSSSFSSGSFREVDTSCLAWLDKQPSRSVIYVSFGSLATLKKEQLMEFWHGLVNSGVHFLWVIRSDAVTGEDKERVISEELRESTRKRGYIVEWAPQEEVLAHSSIGGFLTHCGWNSILESVYEGVPMICWPYFLDQLVNSRFVGEVWKLGLDMKDTCNRVVIEKEIRCLMEVKKDEFVRSSKLMADLAKQSINPDGSSRRNLDRLIEDIKSMSLYKGHIA